MTRVTSLASSRHAVSAAVLLGSVHLSGLSQSSTTSTTLNSVVEVSMRVRDLRGEYPTGGLLYRVIDGRRKHVANVDDKGKPDRKVECSLAEEFEAQAESPFDRAIDPIRLSCSTKLAFNFRRSIQAVNLPELSSQYLYTHAGPSSAVFTSYSAQLFAKGEIDAATSLQEAAVAAAAVQLGDTKMEKYVGRDPSQGFKLVLTAEGVDALRTTQKQAGIPTTGKLDFATQKILANAATPQQKVGTSLPQLHCAGSASGFLTCAKDPDALHVDGRSPDLRRVTIPEMKIPVYAPPDEKKIKIPQ